ncbi:MAG: hypothetical protein IT307_13825 [Chloroflexi bacterium]|nr:hypothetical protein [Chloroflexota bacterium]
MKSRINRRDLAQATMSSLAAMVTACGPSGGQTEVVDSPEGRVYRWERDDLLVLLSDLKDRYRLGEPIALKVLLNNQAGRAGTFRVRTKLMGRGQQVEAEAEVATLQVRPNDAAEVTRTLVPPASIRPGEYSVVVELPAWTLEGERPKGGGSLTAPVQLGA